MVNVNNTVEESTSGLNDRYSTEQLIYEHLRLTKSSQGDYLHQNIDQFDIEYMCKCLGLAIMKHIEAGHDKQHISDLFESNQTFEFFNGLYNKHINWVVNFFDKTNKVVGEISNLERLEKKIGESKDATEDFEEAIGFVGHIRREKDEALMREEELRERKSKLKTNLADIEKDIRFIDEFFSSRKKPKSYQNVSERSKQILLRDLSYVGEVESELQNASSQNQSRKRGEEEDTVNTFTEEEKRLEGIGEDAGVYLEKGEVEEGEKEGVIGERKVEEGKENEGKDGENKIKSEEKNGETDGEGGKEEKENDTNNRSDEEKKSNKSQNSDKLNRNQSKISGGEDKENEGDEDKYSKEFDNIIQEQQTEEMNSSKNQNNGKKEAENSKNDIEKPQKIQENSALEPSVKTDKSSESLESDYVIDVTTVEKLKAYLLKQVEVFDDDFIYSAMHIPTRKYVPPPDPQTIFEFCANIIILTKMEKEVIVISLLYLERFIFNTGLLLTSRNWRRIMFTVLVIASKIWDDDSFENSHFAQVFTHLKIGEINLMERIFLELMDYKIYVKCSEYLKYFFIVKSIALKYNYNGVKMIPISVERMMKIQEYAYQMQKKSRKRNVLINSANF